MPLPFKHLTSTKQLTRSDTDQLLKVSGDMENILKDGGSDLLKGKILASLFMNHRRVRASVSRPRCCVLAANVLTAEGLQFSSLYPGETIEDTMLMVSQYADIIAMRHRKPAARDRAASAAPIPFINAGDGPGQHLHAGALDLYTIQKERGN